MEKKSIYFLIRDDIIEYIVRLKVFEDVDQKIWGEVRNFYFIMVSVELFSGWFNRLFDSGQFCFCG